MKKIVTFLIVAGLLEASIAEAATINSCKVTDFDNSIITVEGTVDEGEKNVTVAVMPEGTALDTGKFYSDAVSVQDAEIADGKFSVSFKFIADEGKYVVNATNAESMDFEWINKESVLEFVDKLGKGQVSATDVYEDLAYYGPSVGVDVSFAKTGEDQNYLAENVRDYAERIEKDGIEGVKNVVNLTRSELEFMEKLESASVASSVNNLIEEYTVSAEIDVTAYNKLTNNQKLKACTELIEGKYSDMDKFRSDFIAAIEKAKKQGSTGGGSTGGGGSSSGGLKPSGTALPIQTTTGQYADNESGKNARLFDIFDDIGNVSWGWESILYAYDNGIMNGVGEKQFNPNGVLTREQFAKIITVAFDKYDKNAVASFKDVDAGNWAASYIASAKNAGLMNGINDSNFGFGKSLTREDICVVIYRAAKNAGITFEIQKTDFSDYKEVSDYAKEAVSFMAGKGIISGMGDGTFAPKGNATRVQAAKLIYAVLGGNN